MVCRLFGVESLPEQFAAYYQLNPLKNELQWNLIRNTKIVSQVNKIRNVIWVVFY